MDTAQEAPPARPARFKPVPSISMDCLEHGPYFEDGFLDMSTGMYFPNDGHCYLCQKPARVLQQDPPWQR